MSLSDHPAYRLVLTHGRAVGHAIAQQVADNLEAMKEPLLSGDDSCLTTVWQEICAQVQGEESFFWDAYETLAQDLITARVQTHSLAELEMLWLSTEPGWDWLWDVVNADEEAPPAHPGINQESVVAWICANFLWPLAESDQHPNVARYLARGDGEDYEDSEDDNDDDLDR